MRSSIGRRSARDHERHSAWNGRRRHCVARSAVSSDDRPSRGGPDRRAEHDVAQVMHIVVESRGGDVPVRRNRQRWPCESIPEMALEDRGERECRCRMSGGKTIRGPIGSRAAHTELQRLHDRLLLEFRAQQIESEVRPLVGLRFVGRQRYCLLRYSATGTPYITGPPTMCPGFHRLSALSTAHQMTVDAAVCRVHGERHGSADAENHPCGSTSWKLFEVAYDVLHEGVEAGMFDGRRRILRRRFCLGR